MIRMPIFDVKHIIGEQGYGEKEILTRDIEARNAPEAILKVAPSECKKMDKKSIN